MMSEKTKATLASQLGDEPCLIGDTEKMFWLREADDYQSRFSLGNALAAQYRFKEAAAVYESAMRIRQDDWKLYYSLGGAYLTLRRFDQAESAYRNCIKFGGEERKVAYPSGIGCYLQNDYAAAASWFEKCLPCDDEMAIAVIYWHTLSRYRAGRAPTLLSSYHKNIDAGHHTAYQLAVCVFCGEIKCDHAFRQIEKESDDLNYVIAMYGLCGYHDHIGDYTVSKQYMDALLSRSGVWPCIPYLAAWGDINGRNTARGKTLTVI